MKRKIYILISCLLVLTLSLAGCANLKKQSYSAAETDDPTDPEWWSLAKCSSEAVKTRDELAALAGTILETSEAGMARPDRLGTITKAEVFEWIGTASFPEKELLNGVPITENDKARILENRNLEEAADNPKAENAGADVTDEVIDVRYALATKNADVRTFPTADRLSNEEGRNDYLQESGLYLGEPMAVLWTSRDGGWYFIQSCNYRGWISKESIGFCSEEFFGRYCALYFEGITPDISGDTDGTGIRRAVVLRNKEYTVGSTTMYQQWVRMGTVLPMTDDSLIFFVRGEDGNIAAETVPLDKDDVRETGELEFSERNIVMLAGRLLGTPYSWGDEDEHGMDCSSTMLSVFRCFGIFLPRNTGDQRKMTVESVDLEEMDSAAKKEIISGFAPGTLLYFPGHVMMYLGEHDGELYLLQNTTSTALDDGTAEFYSCVITPITTGKTGNTYLDRIVQAVKLVR